MSTPEGPPDQELWHRMSRGDSAALGTLFDRYARPVYNHCFRLTASWPTAEDLSSATFLQVWRAGGRTDLRGESALPYLLTVATNLARNERRSQRRRLRLVSKVGVPRDLPDPAEEVASRVDDERRMAAVLRAAGTLPRSEREALALCVWSGISYAEAAAALGIAESSVRSRVSRARSRLAALLGQPTEEPVPTTGDKQ